MTTMRGGKDEEAYHLIGQDTVQPVVIQADHPLQALDLVLLELPTSEHLGLLEDLLLNAMRNSIVVELLLLNSRIIVHLSPSPQKDDQSSERENKRRRERKTDPRPTKGPLIDWFIRGFHTDIPILPSSSFCCAMTALASESR